jgi:hypothetical protein
MLAKSVISPIRPVLEELAITTRRAQLSDDSMTSEDSIQTGINPIH